MKTANNKDVNFVCIVSEDYTFDGNVIYSISLIEKLEISLFLNNESGVIEKYYSALGFIINDKEYIECKQVDMLDSIDIKNLPRINYNAFLFNKNIQINQHRRLSNNLIKKIPKINELAKHIQKNFSKTNQGKQFERFSILIDSSN